MVSEARHLLADVRSFLCLLLLPLAGSRSVAYGTPAGSAMDGQRHRALPLQRSLALYLDGVSRAALFPFGPSLVARLSLHGGAITRLRSEHCPLVALPFAAVVAAYLLGRSVGARCPAGPLASAVRRQRLRQQRLDGLVPRLAGIVVALHVLTFGAGLSSVVHLSVLRFLSAVLVGVLCRITRPLPSPPCDPPRIRPQRQRFSRHATEREQERNHRRTEAGALHPTLPTAAFDAAFLRVPLNDTATVPAAAVGASASASASGAYNHDGDDSHNDNHHADHENLTDAADPQPHGTYVDLRSGTAKVYLTALAVSILTGGLLFRHAASDVTFQNLTGRHPSLTPVFLILVAAIVEILLRILLRSCQKRTAPRTNATARKPSSVPSEMSQTAQVSASALSPPTSSDLPAIDFKAMRPPTRQRMDSVASFKSAVPVRERSTTVESEFFDCNSVLSGMEDLDLFDPDLDDPSNLHSDNNNDNNSNNNNNNNSNNEHAVAQYIDGQCVYSDGTPAFVAAGDAVDTVPTNYLTLCNHREDRARKMWQATQRWRHEWDVWRIHRMPNKWFHDIKKAYPHHVHGYNKAGYPVIYERPGRMNLKELFRNGCEIRDMARHLVFFMEFIAHRIAIRDDIQARRPTDAGPHNSSSWGTMVVMDVQGVSISHLSGDVLRYLKEAGDINNNHYPLTMRRAFLVNSPFWLAGTWSTVKGILPDSVQVDILSSSKSLAALREYIDDDQIPPEYGGSSPYRLGEHPFETALQDLVAEASTHPDDPDPVPFETASSNSIINSNSNSFNEGEFGTVHLENVGNVVDPGGDSDTWKDKLHSPTPLRRRAGSMTIDPESVRPVAALGDNSYGGYTNTITTTTTNNNNNNTRNANDDFATYDGDKAADCSGDKDVLTTVSVLFTLFSTSQGIIETAVPFWIVTPTELGGLGYAPSRSGVSMFCSAMVLLWVMRTKWSRVVPAIPTQEPMRSFRIGTGSQSVLLMLIASVPRTVLPSKRTDSILVMTFTIIMVSCLILSSIFGRSSSTILHRIASDNYGTAVARGQSKRSSSGDWYRSGGLTNLFNLCGELMGVLVMGLMSAWSLSADRPAPFDGTSCLYLSSLLTFVLYVGSFSMHLNSSGQFSPHPHLDGTVTTTTALRKCGSFVCEVATVSLADMASLFEETHYSSLLHRYPESFRSAQAKTV